MQTKLEITGEVRAPVGNDIEGAYPKEANLIGANLTNTNLTGAYLLGAIMSPPEIN